MAVTSQILIIDDHPLFRDGLELACSSLADREVALDKASSLGEGLAKLDDAEFDLVLLDLNLPDSRGLEGLARMREQSPDLNISVISATETNEAMRKAMGLGAVGYLPKSLDLSSLKLALGDLLATGSWYPPEFKPDGEDDGAVSKLDSLTPAQRRVLQGLSEGLLNKQIAYEMGISIATVKAHLTAIFRKLGAHNRTQALLFYKEATGLNHHSAA